MSPEREGRQEVSLRRLSAVARLTPGPAVAVARAVLGRLAVLHLRGQVHGAVTAGAVLVGDDGAVRLDGEGARPAVPPAELAALQRDDVAAAWRLVAALLDATPVTAPASLAALLAGPPPDEGAHGALAAVSAAAGELASEGGARRAAVRLAGLAEPLRRYRHGPPQVTVGPLGAATVITTPAVRAAPAAVPGRRRRQALAGVAGLAVAAALGTGLLATRSSTTPATPRTAATPPAATALPEAPPPPPIPDPPAVAPPSAGVVAAVGLTPTAGPCLPAAVCALQVRVDLVPGHGPATVRLVLELVDRCTGVRSEVALPRLTVAGAAPAARSAVRVRVGAGPAPAIIAVVTAPARAASPPLLVATYLPTC